MSLPLWSSSIKLDKGHLTDSRFPGRISSVIWPPTAHFFKNINVKEITIIVINTNNNVKEKLLKQAHHITFNLQFIKNSNYNTFIFDKKGN